MSLANMRRDYRQHVLLEQSTGDDPLALFMNWFAEAKERCPEANACVVATVDDANRPSARVLLCKGCDESGFRFFTNLESRKGQELARNPQVALCFHWHELERQVRIEGEVELLSREEVEAYFVSRPRTSQLGAWASPQSQVIESREVLEQAFGRLETVHSRGDVPVPPHWGGYVVKPRSVEFWQGRSSRLHDRLCYTKDGDSWQRDRLAP